MAGHIGEFAAQLAALKERSGKSYGTLAQRLHLSTSTLHRYCNGAAVPAEYAPVERFARLCGASAEELVGLHRRWLLADAERRNDAAVVGGESLVTVEAPAPAPATPESGPVDTPTADSGSVETLATSEPAAATNIGRAADPESAPEHTSQTDRPNRRSRRRKTVLGAAATIVTAAVAVPLTVHAARGSDPTRPSAAPTRPQTPPQTSASPAAPFAVTVLADNWDTECGQWFLATRSPAAVPPLPAPADVSAWAAALHAIPANHLRLQVTAQGMPGGPPVILHTAYVRIVAAHPEPKGNGYSLSSGCGGPPDPASFAIDLDAATPRARAVPGLEGDNPAAVSDFPFQVTATDAVVLDIDAGTVGQDVSWYLDLVWSSGDQQGELRVDDHGRPFRTVGLKGDPLYFYNGRAWTPTTLS